MGTNKPIIYHMNESFLVFEPEHALALRRSRVIGASVNPTFGPYCYSKFSIAAVFRYRLATFKRFEAHANVDLEENRLKFSKILSAIVEKEREEYNQQRLMELGKRGIPVTEKTVKPFDESKLRLAITNLPTDDCSALKSVTLSDEEIENLIDFRETKTVIFLNLYRKGYFVSSGMKFGCDYLAYEGDPVRYHAQYAIKEVDCVQRKSLVDLTKLDFNEINSFLRLTHSASKIPVFATMSATDGNTSVSYWTVDEREYLHPESTCEIFKLITLDLRNRNKQRRVIS